MGASRGTSSNTGHSSSEYYKILRDSPGRLAFSTIAVTKMMLAAESYEFDTAPMEGFDPIGVKRAFGIPAEAEVVALLAIGHFKAPDKGFPGRFPLERIAFSEYYGQPLGGR